MSLSKQLLILISALFLIIFSLNFVLSVKNIRGYLEGESQIHAQDTATSLGLSLSPYMVDEKDPVIETMMKAIFDRGYYKEIKLVDVEGKKLVALTNDEKFESVPDWFINNVPMQAAMAESEISSGWSISGVVSVAINPGYAYLKLYEQVKTSFYYSLIAFVVSVIFLRLVLQITLSSLKRIGEMAETISKGSFDIIEQLPWTLEVRRVAMSMNVMSRKLENVIQNLNRKLDSIGKKLQLDDLTGLSKKSGFETDMKDVLSSHEEAFVFMIKIDALTSLVKELGSDSIDQFIKDFAKILQSASENNEMGEISVYRFFGSEFVLLARVINAEQVELLAQSLSESFTELGEKYQKTDIAHTGVAAFDPFSSTDNMLLGANEAYEQAQLIGANSYYLRKGEDRAKDMAEWKELVFDIVDKNDYKVSYISPIESFQTNDVMMKDAFTEALDKNGDVLSIGTFVSIAEKFVKIVELDEGVTSRIVNYIKNENVSHAVAINLSNRTIKNSDFRAWLSLLLESNQAVAKQLVFSLSAYAVAKEVHAYKEFINFIHQLNAKVMIKRFDTQSMSPELIKELKPDFIRLARDIGSDIKQDAAKQEFARTIMEIGGLLDIEVLAENVQADVDFICLKEIGITGASR
ncbi:MAG: signal protein [Cycloclasticus sp. symbiont of Bathymodiolus heckerae]|nr:MAG: signal protein [Cycloclasticus sp. symbiont of Bathymodiolus heckerae]